ncbi:SRPBCC family protein [Sedimentitalea sp. CY04]|uniref:SRPBCC family protein n=1 Tax=Parasedimentitalea denitrificans TaxID=2211118 RepID=A0ABX0WA36_9RHOB|nr:SRPBCC family protein [Sedimentitalea sp. CY04]NIZ61021.1 SRPBCC family protein [Sedimentitalea sp. CY04]
MIQFERTLEIDATPEAVWAVLGRYMHIDEFAPLVKSVDALTNGEDGVGSKRRCHFDNGTSVVEEVTAWVPNRKCRVKLSDMEAMPLNEAHAELVVEPVGQGKSKVKWGMEYRVKFGPLGWLLGQTLMKMMMGKILDGNLNGLASKVQSAPA